MHPEAAKLDFVFSHCYLQSPDRGLRGFMSVPSESGLNSARFPAEGFCSRRLKLSSSESRVSKVGLQSAEFGVPVVQIGRPV